MTRGSALRTTEEPSRAYLVSQIAVQYDRGGPVGAAVLKLTDMPAGSAKLSSRLVPEDIIAKYMYKSQPSVCRHGRSMLVLPLVGKR